MQTGKNEKMLDYTSITFKLMKYGKFDSLQKLVPMNNLVCRTDKIPGLSALQFPTPTMEARDKKVEVKDMPTVKAPAPLYIHHIEFYGSPLFEKKFSKLVAQMYSIQQMDNKGR